MGILQSSLFQEISNLISLIANVCVLFMTAYTLYLTVFSKKISFISMGCEYNTFNGDKLYLYLKNRSLHDIPICNVFILKKLDKKYNRIAIADYEEPFILHFGHVCRIESNFFTEIMKFENEEFDDLQMNALIGIDTGEKLIWIKPYKKAPYYSAIREYKKFNFDTLSVSRRVIDGKVVSKSVSYVIRIIGTDINGHKKINTIFMICSSESGILSEPINGCNAIDIAYCKSAAAIKEYICNSLHIQENIIDVKQIGKGGLT